MSKLFIGIDPGLSGAVAFITDDGLIDIADTPTFQVVNGKKKRNEYDVSGMNEIINRYSKHDHIKSVSVALEKIHSMPGQGVRSMFTMGEGFGVWKGIIAANGYSLSLIAPQAWKKAMMPGMGKEKDASRLRALQLFPDLHEMLKLKKHHGRADALLLAEFHRKSS